MQSQNVLRVDTSNVPAHVPRELIVDYDIWATPETADPFKTVDRFHAGPPIFYTPVHYAGNAGAWILTRAEDIQAVMSDPDLFGSKSKSGFTALIGESWDLAPLEVDPPEHRQLRSLLDPIFSPKRIEQLTPGLRQFCNKLMDDFGGRGEVEFVSEFARPYPVKIFLELMGLPMDDFDQFVEWGDMLLRSPTIEGRVKGGKAIRDYLLALIEQRRKNPGNDDVTSRVVNATIDGQPLPPHRLIGMLYLLFIAGLDTTASSLGFFFKHLAENPDNQQKLRANPALIPQAVEELLRTHSVVTTGRHVMRDTTVGGVQMKAGDWIAIGLMFGSRDPAEHKCPAQVDFDRPMNRHMAFATGVHRCLGSHLGRKELVVAMEEWLKRMPPFRIKQGETPRMHGGIVFGVDYLPLSWSR
ncbi:MAG: Camphor 5-monooxygenase [Nevskia sp.]|nr:Camphor 5-monooxygenase [Nevskia sp.]